MTEKEIVSAVSLATKVANRVCHPSIEFTTEFVIKPNGCKNQLNVICICKDDKLADNVLYYLSDVARVISEFIDKKYELKAIGGNRVKAFFTI
jgi:hypothetical protein